MVDTDRWNTIKVLCFYSYFGRSRNDDGSVRESSKPILYSDAIMIHVSESSNIPEGFRCAIRRHFAAFSDRMVGSIPISFWLDGYLPENGRRYFERK